MTDKSLKPVEIETKPAHEPVHGLIPKQVEPEKHTPFGVEPAIYHFEGFTVQGNAITVTDPYIRNWFRSATRDGAWYSEVARSTLPAVFRHLEDATTYVEENKDHRAFGPFLGFVQYMDGAFEVHRKIIEDLMSEGRITYDYLWFFFKKGMKVEFKQGDDLMGGEITFVNYRYSMFGSYFQVDVKTISTDGRQFVTKVIKTGIGQFKEALLFEDLPVRPLTESSALALAERGALYAKIAIGAHFLDYKGALTRKGSWVRPSVEYKADGRVMVDLPNFKRTDPDYFNSDYSYDDDDEKGEKMNALAPELYYMTAPTVHGFSFACKKWGEIRLANLSEIKWDDSAYDRLVLDNDYKELVYALVKNTSKDSSFTDIISGKGGGCIFLLHGKPGTGKTLTAEAVAELLHRPLYSVSIGELGTNPDTLETRLRTILEIAETWNAVLLLDEADIFLEARNDHDIVRNAMVGIFLRLLEYHQGVMFLTTNRAKNIDTAMQSRIAVAIAYEDHDSSNRFQIWMNLLSAAGITSLSADDVRKLAEKDINGRQIKTNIRLAQCLAHDKGVDVTIEMIEGTISLAEKFKADLTRS